MKNKRLRDIVIDLTSLLDVVMILIFGVMIKNAQLVEASGLELAETQMENVALLEELEELKDVSKELEEALAMLEEGNVEELLNEVQELESRLEAYGYMEDIVVVYNVGLENRYDNSERYLTYGKASEENKNSSAKKRDTEKWLLAMNSLKIDLDEFLDKEFSEQEDKYVYLIFSVDENKVYSNDFNDVVKALEAAETKYDNGQLRVIIKKLNLEGE